MIELWVNGIPKAQPRPRAFARGGRARVYDPSTAEGWKGQIAMAMKSMRPSIPIDNPVEMQVDFYLPRPQRLMKAKDPGGVIPHTAKPDIDNLLKAVMDCITQIGVWKDDTQVAKITSTKYYHAKIGRPGALIRIREIGGDAA